MVSILVLRLDKPSFVHPKEKKNKSIYYSLVFPKSLILFNECIGLLSIQIYLTVSQKSLLAILLLRGDSIVKDFPSLLSLKLYKPFIFLNLLQCKLFCDWLVFSSYFFSFMWNFFVHSIKYSSQTMLTVRDTVNMGRGGIYRGGGQP